MTQNIIVIGCGGREHAIVKALMKSTSVSNVYVFGPYRNPGIDLLINNQFMDQNDNYYICDVGNMEEVQHQLLKLMEKIEHKIDFAVVGPEKPLGEGIFDLLTKDPFFNPTLGPNKESALLETSKIYARELMYQDPVLKEYCPKFKIFYDDFSLDKLKTTFQEFEYNFVVKPSELAGGKGVKIFNDANKNIGEALNYCLMLKNGFIVEEYLEGEEISFISLTDGDLDHKLLHFPPVQDNKNAYDFDQGPNTGGMGAVLSADHFLNSFLTMDDIELLQDLNTWMMEMVKKCCNGYDGFLFGGYLKTKKGEIKILEYNVRLGDPEGINILENLEYPDFATLCQTTLNSGLTKDFIDSVRFKNKHTIVHYVVPSTYPEEPNNQLPKNQMISLKNLSHDEIQENVIFGATKYLGKADLNLETMKMSKYSRTLAIVVSDENYLLAIQKIRSLLCRVEGQIRYRFDIGNKFLNPNSNQNQLSTNTKISYQDAGVNIEEAEKSVEEIKQKVQETYNSSVIPNFGGFGGLTKVNNTVLVSSIDGTGTKSKFLPRILPRDVAIYNLGRDVFYANLNDIIVVADHVKPLFFLDYFSTHQLKSEDLKYFVSGVADACKENDTVLIGGETAEMKTHLPDTYDLVGAIVGQVVPAKELSIEEINNILANDPEYEFSETEITRLKEYQIGYSPYGYSTGGGGGYSTGGAGGYSTGGGDNIICNNFELSNNNQDPDPKYKYYHKSLIQEGHMVLGIKSNGLHTNGYSLINTLMDRNLLTPQLIKQYMGPLCSNHRNYLPFLTLFREAGLQPSGLCHITGGGLIENPKRILPDDMSIEWDYDLLIDQMPDFYKMLQSLTMITSREEMMRTFNLGYGFLIIVKPDTFKKYINLCPEDTVLLGKIKKC